MQKAVEKPIPIVYAHQDFNLNKNQVLGKQVQSSRAREQDSDDEVENVKSKFSQPAPSTNFVAKVTTLNYNNVQVGQVRGGQQKNTVMAGFVQED